MDARVHNLFSSLTEITALRMATETNESTTVSLVYRNSHADYKLLVF